MSSEQNRGSTPERRQFIRVKIEIPVKYKFLSHDPGFSSDEIFDGVTSNLSAGGLLLVGRIPNLNWIPGLLMERIIVGVNMHMPGFPDPVKALCRVSWLEAVEEKTGRAAMGLRFAEITKQHEDVILQFVIRSQMP
ncbi:MAG: PilZ domain-containing protein [Planctomycetota bacterium]|nr:PilZ domain-containing protein [Planctomycetota bacterium]